MSSLVVNLSIAADEYQRMYAGSVSHVAAVSVDGRRVRFPANILRPFVTLEGIQGRFIIRFDRDSRFQGIDRLT